MSQVTYQELLDAGVHFGHLKRKWNPKMAPYIFMERNGIHIIDLNKTLAKLDEAAAAIKQIVKSGKKVMFVATKKQAKEIVATEAKRLNMPYITERWPGGMLTNFSTIRKSVKKMANLDKMMTDGTFENISKKERLQVSRQKAKMDRFLGSVTELNRVPAAIFIVDPKKEHIAVSEAIKLNIPTIAITDTNCDPSLIDFPIPGNDDAAKSVASIMAVISKAIEEGLAERKVDKENDREKEVADAEEAEDSKAVVMGDDSDAAPAGSEKKPAGARTRKPTTTKR